MAATFREVAVYSGVDESLPTGGQGIVVPSGGSTLVILQDGKGLNVQSTVPAKVHVHEFTKNQEQTDAAKKASNPSEAKQRFGNGSWRIFRIEADTPVGFDKVTVEAKNAKGKAEATLKVLVVEKKPVKVHIRPVHVHNGKEFVPLSKGADPNKLLGRDERHLDSAGQCSLRARPQRPGKDQGSFAADTNHRDAKVASGISRRTGFRLVDVLHGSKSDERKDARQRRHHCQRARRRNRREPVRQYDGS